jgi:hypothetical protein
MTRADAEMIYAWLIRRYGDPSERSTAITFVSRDDYYQRERDSHCDPKVRRHEHRQHQQARKASVAG